MWQKRDNLTKLDDEQDNLTKISQSSLFKSELNVWIWVQEVCTTKGFYKDWQPI